MSLCPFPGKRRTAEKGQPTSSYRGRHEAVARTAVPLSQAGPRTPERWSDHDIDSEPTANRLGMQGGWAAQALRAWMVPNCCPGCHGGANQAKRFSALTAPPLSLHETEGGHVTGRASSGA